MVRVFSSWALRSAGARAWWMQPAETSRETWRWCCWTLGGMSPQTPARYFKWAGGGVMVRGVPEEAAFRMAGVASGEGEQLTSGAGEVAWVGELAPGAGGAVGRWDGGTVERWEKACLSWSSESKEKENTKTGQETFCVRLKQERGTRL